MSVRTSAASSVCTYPAAIWNLEYVAPLRSACSVHDEPYWKKSAQNAATGAKMARMRRIAPRAGGSAASDAAGAAHGRHVHVTAAAYPEDRQRGRHGDARHAEGDAGLTRSRSSG